MAFFKFCLLSFLGQVFIGILKCIIVFGLVVSLSNILWVICNNVYINNSRSGIYHKNSMEKKYLCKNPSHCLPVTSHLSQVYHCTLWTLTSLLQITAVTVNMLCRLLQYGSCWRRWGVGFQLGEDFTSFVCIWLMHIKQNENIVLTTEYIFL